MRREALEPQKYGKSFEKILVCFKFQIIWCFLQGQMGEKGMPGKVFAPTPVLPVEPCRRCPGLLFSLYREGEGYYEKYIKKC